MALRKKITMVMLTAVMTLSAAMLHSSEQAQAGKNPVTNVADLGTIVLDRWDLVDVTSIPAGTENVMFVWDDTYYSDNSMKKETVSYGDDYFHYITGGSKVSDNPYLISGIKKIYTKKGAIQSKFKLENTGKRDKDNSMWKGDDPQYNKAPMCKLRFDNEYVGQYRNEYDIKWGDDDAYTIEADYHSEKNYNFPLGSGYYMNLFVNFSTAGDNYLGSSGNSLRSATESRRTDFLIYTKHTESFAALSNDYTVKAGNVLNIDRNAFIPEGKTLTVEAGGIVNVTGKLFNDGKIVNHGTIVVGNKGFLAPFDVDGNGGGITCEKGGDLIILSDGVVASGAGSMTLSQGSNCIGYGTLATEESLNVDDSLLDIREYGMVMVGREFNHSPALLINATSSMSGKSSRQKLFMLTGAKKYTYEFIQDSNNYLPTVKSKPCYNLNVTNNGKVVTGPNATLEK